jgi:hypothetical protein
MLLFAVKPPGGLVPPMPAPEADRTTALLAWAEGPNGCGLIVIQEVLKTILAPRFAGEPARPSSICDVKVVSKDVAGRVTGVRAKLADIKGVTVVTGDVKKEGEVTGIDLA